jgi:hypothetical protein
MRRSEPCRRGLIYGDMTACYRKTHKKLISGDLTLSLPVPADRRKASRDWDSGARMVTERCDWACPQAPAGRAAAARRPDGRWRAMAGEALLRGGGVSGRAKDRPEDAEDAGEPRGPRRPERPRRPEMLRGPRGPGGPERPKGPRRTQKVQGGQRIQRTLKDAEHAIRSAQRNYCES